MTVLHMTIRRPPPCRHCNRGRVPSPLPWEKYRWCPACQGRSGQVEFFVEYGPLKGRKVVWEPEDSSPYALERI